MLENKKAVIFDLDGTITDSMWVWTQIDREFFAGRGIEMPPTLQKDIEGMSFTETAAYFIETFSLDETVEEVKKTWNEMAVQKYAYETPLKDGVLSFLQYLKEKNIKAGISTSNSRLLLDVFLRERHLEHLIDAVTTSCDVNKGKPAPDVYLKTAEKLDADPGECLVFEDLPMGILAGKNAGMSVCAVEDDYSAHLRNRKKELADYYITDYRQVMKHTYEVLR